MTTCPTCGARGRTLGATTLASQVDPRRLASRESHDGWRLCRSLECPTVYFNGSAALGRDAVRATPFEKSSDPARLVCFCFGHSVAAVEADLREHGRSTLRESIEAACKAGLDDCERKNPQGRCCLGNVAQVIRGAGAESLSDSSAATDCCAPSDEATEAPANALSAPLVRAGGSGLLASSGAVVAAALSSACCWLPLVAIGLGASTAGVGAFFAAWRLPLLLIAVALLGGGFYLAYRRPRCAPGTACAVPNRRLQRLSRVSLWMTAALVGAFALFPEVVSAVTGGGGEAAAPGQEQSPASYAVGGMTCTGCEAHAREALESLPGVASAAVSFSRGTAEVVWNGAPNDAAAVDALTAIGYRAHRLPGRNALASPRPEHAPTPSAASTAR